MRLSLAPLLGFTLLFICGIVASSVGWVGVAAALLCAVMALVFRRGRVGVALIGFAIGACVAILHTPHTPAFDGESRLYSGTVLSLRHMDGAQLLVIEVDSAGGKPCEPFKLQAFVPGISPTLDEADHLSFITQITGPGREPSLPDAVDYGRQLLRKGITAHATVISDSISGVYPEPGMLNSIRRFRHEIAYRLAWSGLSDGASGFLIAALTGDREMLDVDSQELFSAAGVAHILALSGLHVAIISWIISVLLIPLAFCRVRKAALGITIVALWGFAVLTGLTPSVVRAVVMATLFGVTLMLERHRASLNSLCIAALVILFVAPEAVYSLGFQLSFISVLSILIFAPPLLQLIRVPRWLWPLWSGLCVSVSAIMGSGLVAAFTFGFFPVYFLPVNLIVGLALPVLLTGGVLITIFGGPGWVVAAVEWLYQLIYSIIKWFATLPGATPSTLTLPEWSFWGILFAIGLLAVALHRRHWAYALASVTVAVVTIIAIALTPTDYPQQELFLTGTSSETTAIVREGSVVTSFTTIRPAFHNELRKRLERQLDRYLRKRGVDSISVVGGGQKVITLRGKSIMMSTAPLTDTLQTRLDYLVVCKGFNGDLRRQLESCSPDSVIFSSDLHHATRRKFSATLDSVGQPYRLLKDGPVIIR